MLFGYGMPEGLIRKHFKGSDYSRIFYTDQGAGATVSYDGKYLLGNFRTAGVLAVAIAHFLMKAKKIDIVGMDGYTLHKKSNLKRSTRSHHCYGSGYTDDASWDQCLKKDERVLSDLRGLDESGVKFNILTPTKFDEFFDPSFLGLDLEDRDFVGDVNCDFNPHPKYLKKVREYIEEGLFHWKNGILISKEFPDNEAGAKEYDRVWERRPTYSDGHVYEGAIVKMCEKYAPDARKVLDVGAGFGTFASQYLNKNSVETYDAYEFSGAYDTLKTLDFPGFKAYQESFQGISVDQYDLVIALEVLEHINWDKEFLFKIPSGRDVIISVPYGHAPNHVRAFAFPNSVAHRYGDLLDIHEIQHMDAEGRASGSPKWWFVAARRK